MATPKKNVAYEIYITLSSGGSFVVNPTIAEGDFQVQKDDGAMVNLETTPVVTPAGGRLVRVSLSADEMNADKVNVIGVDVAGAQWDDVHLEIDVPNFNEEDYGLLRQYVYNYSTVTDLGGGAKVVRIWPDGNTDGSGPPQYTFTVTNIQNVETRTRGA